MDSNLNKETKEVSDKNDLRFYVKWFYTLLLIFIILFFYKIVYSFIPEKEVVWLYDKEIYSIVQKHNAIDKQISILLAEREKTQPLLDCLVWLREIEVTWNSETWSLDNPNCKKERVLLDRK